ncbi:hypothetical protein SynBIOSE41_02673 [Synechococcus sp. BIOS-E4-1]|nr:hypothetical protein SynBIOSE41_02673 [Synechococcus sp. BIOS-E4-1]
MKPIKRKQTLFREAVSLYPETVFARGLHTEAQTPQLAVKNGVLANSHPS